MAALAGSTTLNLSADTSATALYTLWKNTICPGMGFSNATELVQDITNTRLVYTKTNLTGTYSTTYWRFGFATNNVTMNLYHAYNTSTDVGTGLINAYNNVSFSIVCTSFANVIYYWKDDNANPQWGMVNVRRADNISMGDGGYNGGYGWCKITPFSIMDANVQPTTLFISSSNSTYNDRTNFINSSSAFFYGGNTVCGTTQYQGKSLQTFFSLGNATGSTNTYGRQVSSTWLQTGTTSASTSPIITTPVIVGSHGLALGYINDLDLGVTMPLEYDKYRVEDRLVVSAGIEEWQPTGRYANSLFVRVV